MTSKQFCLKWTNFHNNILNAFQSLQNTEDLTDVTLTCEGISVKAHRFILSACSPYFRTVFKDNPCSHPIIILKDVLYMDLVAIINFMYHGEVLVSEEQLPSFLQTAKLLQVSGLNNTNDTASPKIPKKTKQKPELEQTTKKIKLTNKQPKSPESCDEEYQPDVNENVEVLVKSDPPSSILGAALEKPESILERSLMSVAGKSPVHEPPPRKPPENESDSDLLQPTIKIEEDSYDSFDPDEGHMSKQVDVQPHHSSQCGNCPHCGKVYSNQSALKYHVRLVHSDLTNMYCCHLCPESFNYREGYKKHMVDAHCIRN